MWKSCRGTLSSLHLAKGVGVGVALSLFAPPPNYPSCPQEAHRHTLLLQSRWRGTAGMGNATESFCSSLGFFAAFTGGIWGRGGSGAPCGKRRASHLGFDFRDHPGHPPLPPALPATPDIGEMLSPEHNSFSLSERYL